MSDPSATSTPTWEVVARAGSWYRNARYIVVVAMLGAGLWCAHDGWVKWPTEKAVFDATATDRRGGMRSPHTDFEIRLQQEIATGLLVLAPLMLGWFLFRSRGAYRLSETSLDVPGHPAVPIEAITAIDKSKWARKGIARVEYQLSESARPRWLTLDDFIYQREPTDQIVARIEAWVVAHGPAQDDSDEGGDDADESPANS